MKLLLVLALVVATVNAAKLGFDAQPAFSNSRIINGENAMIGEAPFMVSLQRRLFGHFCAGSVISENWVLTAAHCLGTASFDVVVGLHDRNNKSDVQIRHVSGKQFQVIHENYTGGVGPFDIGLIYIKEAFDLNVISRDGSAPVGKINLASGKYEQVGKGKLYGWGVDNSGYLANILQTLTVNIIGYEECKAALPTDAPLHPTNICTYTPKKPDGSCSGDSGGPLITYTPNGAEQVGIVSWGYVPCASTDMPSVYTQVSAYNDWIEDSIDNFNANQISNE